VSFQGPEVRESTPSSTSKSGHKIDCVPQFTRLPNGFSESTLFYLSKKNERQLLPSPPFELNVIVLSAFHKSAVLKTMVGF
jgi:hypothetical protein